jgi:hypothetical protein
MLPQDWSGSEQRASPLPGVDLTAMGHTIPHAPIKVTTAALMALIGQTTTSHTGR